MTLFLIAQTMFGNMFAIRILRRIRDRSLISQSSLTKIGTLFAFAISFGAIFHFFAAASARMPLLFIIIGLVVLQIALKVREKQRIEWLASRFPHFLDRWLLNLRMGMASTVARERALVASDEQFRALLAPLFETSTDDRHPFLTLRVVQELRAAHNQPHNTVARLQSLRRCVARESGFRRKSGQALRQSSIQSLVLAFMHAGLVLFTVARGSASNSLDLIAVSTLLTVSGILILRLLARRIRWTI